LAGKPAWPAQETPQAGPLGDLAVDIMEIERRAGVRRGYPRFPQQPRQNNSKIAASVIPLFSTSRTTEFCEFAA
jgi:hypothetical protein